MLQKTIIIQGLKVSFWQSEDLDKENALVFLHGWGSRALHFRKTLEKCDNFVAVDLPGFGDSEMPPVAWSLGDYADFVEEFLKKLGIEKPILAGHSLGGSIAIKYCASGNDVKKNILIGSAGIRRKTLKKCLFFVVAKIFKSVFMLPGLAGLRDSMRKKFYKTIDSEDYINAGAMTETYRKIISEDLTEELNKIKIPTVLIWGEQDAETPLEDGELIQKLIPNAELHVIPEAGHYVFLDKDKEFEKIFLTELK